jgi:hypothetical protein
MHVPKAAGTTMIEQIEFTLRPRRSEYRLDGTQFGAFDRFHTMDKNIRTGIVFDLSQIPEDTDVLMGHVGLKTLEKRFPEARKATIVREPVARLISQWLYHRTYDDEKTALYGDWGEAIALSRLPLRTYISQRDIFCLTDNVLTRMLLWPHPLIPENAPLEPAHDDFLYREARAALDRFDYIDSAENEELIGNFSAWLDVTYGRALVSRLKTLAAHRNKPTVKNAFVSMKGRRSFDIDAEIAEAGPALKARTRIDQRLWDYIVSGKLGKSAEVFRCHAWQSAIGRYRSAATFGLDPVRSHSVTGG